jgi:hypothetical protein
VKMGRSLDAKNPDHCNILRFALLDFIADFSDWDNSTVFEYLETARALTQSAHEALGGQPGTRPLVVDPFAGGGAIPLEALRVGADAFASDLNPLPILLNKVALEYVPRYGARLSERRFAEQPKELLLHGTKSRESCRIFLGEVYHLRRSWLRTSVSANQVFVASAKIYERNCLQAEKRSEIARRGCRDRHQGFCLVRWAGNLPTRGCHVPCLRLHDASRECSTSIVPEARRSSRCQIIGGCLHPTRRDWKILSPPHTGRVEVC